jgi:hypothetical protein
MANPNEHRSVGTLYEYIFIAEALRRKLQPHVPVGDYLPHDVVVYDSDGACKRVQIKGTACSHIERGHKRSPRFRITVKVGADAKLLTPEMADVVACYVAPWDYWYLIPIDELVGRAIWLYPHQKDSRGQYEKYRNKWDIFNAEENHTPS